MKPPLHTVIMPVYNGAAYLAEAIGSVLGQHCADLELIVVDDCSSDGSAAIVRHFAARDARLRCLSTGLNTGGPARPKNLGLALARGHYVSFCDQDDILLPGKLALAGALFARHPQLDLLFFDFAPFTSDPTQPDVILGPSYLAGKQFTARAAAYLAPLDGQLFQCRRFWGCMAGIDTGISTQTVVCRRHLLAGQCFDPRFRIVDDLSLWYRLAEVACIGYAGQTVARYRHHPQALTGNRALLALESIAFHRENYFRQRALLEPAEDRRYRHMLARLLVRGAALPGVAPLEARSYLLQSLVFDFKLRPLRWAWQTWWA